MKTGRRPAGVKAAMKGLKKDAHERVLARGLVQFRLDRDNMQELLKLADEKGLGYGVMARMWICERLDQERSKSSNADLSQLRKIIRQEVEQALKAPSRKGQRAV